jgi:LacI family transcriptional regulator, gluconate utilization system Gnt-I transcriptional repressor
MAPLKQRTRKPPGRDRAARRAPTLADVARIAGVSKMTASRALSGQHVVAPETAAQVRAAADLLAYVPNRVAGGLSSQKSHVIIAVIPSTLNPVFADLVETLRTELDRAGYHLFLGLSEYDTARKDALITTIIARRPAAIILTGVLHSSEIRRRLIGAQIPVVETWDLTPTPIDMLVGFSNENIGRAAAEYLIERGRRRLALISADDQRAQVRRKGFLAAAEERGATLISEIALRAPTTLGMGREAFGRLLDGGSFEAVFCTSDQLAMGALYEANARAIQVPDQIAVMGFGDLAASAHTQPSLTTVAVDGKRIGQEAVRMLLERLDPGQPQRCPAERIVDVGFRVIARESA